jgi:hypothetical protein
MPREELAAVEKYIEEMLSKGFITPSNAGNPSPVVLLVKKPEGGLRFCLDYRGLNEMGISSANHLNPIAQYILYHGIAKRKPTYGPQP